MAGNSQRQGARRKTPRKGAVVGTGGHNRRSLQGRGPTPPAEERFAHPAKRRAAAKNKAGAAGSRSAAGSAAPAKNPAGSARGAGGRGAGAGRRPARRSSREGLETVAGRNAVVEALRAGVPATALYVATRIDSDDRVREALKRAGDLRLPLLEASRLELDRLADGASHQGMLLQVPPYEYAAPMDLLERAYDDGGPPLVVALDGVTDPRNLGAVVRSTAAFGGHGVLVPERRAAGMTASAWKASAGAAAGLPVARAPNLTRAIEDYKKAGLFVAGLDVDGATTVEELKVAADPLVLLVGSEGKGLSRLVKSSCDMVVRIPMPGKIESLNAGVAAGIALYAIARARQSGSS